MGVEASNGPPSNVEAPSTSASAAAAGPTDYAAQQWAAAAAMQSYYGVAQQQQQQQQQKQQQTPNGQQQATQAATAYYAQMAQHPNLYAQLWAGPTMAPAPFPGAANGTPFTYPTMTAYGAPHGGVQQAPQVGVAPGVYGNTNQAVQGGQKANGAATANGGGRPERTMGEANGNGHHAVQAGGDGVVNVNGINGVNGVNGAANLWASQSRGTVGVGGGQQHQQHMSAGANNNNGTGAVQHDERELKRQRRKQSNRESARRSRLRKQAECEELGSRVGGLTEENEKLRGEVKRLLDQCTALSSDNTKLRESVQAAGGVVDTPAPELPAGPTQEEKEAAAKAGAAAAAEAMEAAKKAAALAAGDSEDGDAEDGDGGMGGGSKDGKDDDEDDDSK